MSSSKLFASFMNSRCALHRVAITGKPHAMASMNGRPQPSPLVGSTKACAAVYSDGSALSGNVSVSATMGATSWRAFPHDARRNSSMADSIALCRSDPFDGPVGYVRNSSVTSSSGVNALAQARRRTSHPLRYRHSKTLRNTVPRNPGTGSGAMSG